MVSSMVDSTDIQQNLKILGLSEEESIVYINLLNKTSAGILEISREVNIPRTNVYRICDELVKKKFAKWIVGDRGSNIEAVRPRHLDFLIKEKESELEGYANSLNSLQEMAQDIATKVPKTQVRYYQGKEGIKQIIWNTLKAKNEVFGYSEFGRIEVVGKAYYTKYVEEFKFRKIKDRAISNQKCLDYYVKYVIGKENIHQIDKDNVKIIPKNIFYVSGDHSIYNDIYSMSYWKSNEVVGVEIQNPELVKLHKTIFELMWKLAEPVEKYLK